MNKKNAKFSLPPLNHFSSRKEWEDACWKKIVQSGAHLNALTTPNERRNLIMRAAAVDRIRAGEKYRQIGKALWLSPQTIGSIKKAMGEGGYKSYRERGKSSRKKRMYSRDPVLTRRKPRGRPVRTKYGTVYLP